MMAILASVSLTDRIQVPSARHLTDSGQMIVPCAFARTGAQNYTAGQLGLTDTASDKVVTVMRDEADVFDSASSGELHKSTRLIIENACLCPVYLNF